MMKVFVIVNIYLILIGSETYKKTGVDLRQIKIVVDAKPRVLVSSQMPVVVELD